jgi:hypothetical protein
MSKDTSKTVGTTVRGVVSIGGFGDVKMGLQVLHHR